MSTQTSGPNYKRAKTEADKADEKIFSALERGVSFRVEAGAGSGKTYSLNQAIDWIKEHKAEELSQKKQEVICITYTNVAVDVIAERIGDNPAIIPSTIHAFAWRAIRRFQKILLSYAEDDDFEIKESDFSRPSKVEYTLGSRYVEAGTLYLSHNDVIEWFVRMLGEDKFQDVFSRAYPIILIDEYQDSYGPLIQRFLEVFISKGIGPQFGLFGDAWQTIYQFSGACGLVDHESIEVIEKNSNFRSAPVIVAALNKMRPTLPQHSAVDECDGEILVITCEDYDGPRRKDGHFKNDLPVEEIRSRLQLLEDYVNRTKTDEESLKTLMLTHKILAQQQGYEQLQDCLRDKLRGAEDEFLKFFMEIVEPIYNSLQTGNMNQLLDAIKRRRAPVGTKSDKGKWASLKDELDIARKGRAIDVLNVVKDSGLVPMPPKVVGYYHEYSSGPEMMYGKTTIGNFLDIEYRQFVSAANFLLPESVYSTDHGVKGEEYEHVIFVVSKGWNQYQFDQYAPMMLNEDLIPPDKEKSYVRNRNLFYVCCSRPKKRLVIFVTHPVEKQFEEFLVELAGKENVYTFSEFQEYSTTPN